MTVVTGTMTRVRGRSVAFVDARTVDARPREVVRRPAKVARILALAHHIQGAIERGVVADRAVVARQLGLTRARVTQLLDLTLLAPDIQEVVLGLEAVDGVEPMFEGNLRPVVRAVEWGMQRALWRVQSLSQSATTQAPRTAGATYKGSLNSRGTRCNVRGGLGSVPSCSGSTDVAETGQVSVNTVDFLGLGALSSASGRAGATAEMRRVGDPKGSLEGFRSRRSPTTSGSSRTLSSMNRVKGTCRTRHRMPLDDQAL